MPTSALLLTNAAIPGQLAPEAGEGVYVYTFEGIDPMQATTPDLHHYDRAGGEVIELGRSLLTLGKFTGEQPAPLFSRLTAWSAWRIRGMGWATATSSS